MGSDFFRDFFNIWPLPDSYLTVDIETTGFSPVKNCLCSFGCTVVQDRKPVDTKLIVLNWFEHATTNEPAFREELEKVAAGMAERGLTCHHNEAYLRKYGVPPLTGLAEILDILQRAEAGNVPLVGTNCYKFDAEFIQAHVHDFLGIDWLIGDNSMYDIGLMEKAAQLPDTDSPLPLSSETMRAWAYRIGDLRRKGVKWAMDSYVEPKYRIMEKYGLDRGRWHTSDWDSMYLHYLAEEQRKQAEVR